jgi:hypothetical protein
MNKPTYTVLEGRELMKASLKKDSLETVCHPAIDNIFLE